MSEKRQLPKTTLRRVIRALEEGEYEEDYSTVFEEKTSYITVEEYANGKVSVEYNFRDDGAKFSAPKPTVHYSVTVAGLEFVTSDYCGARSDWRLNSAKYFIVYDDMQKIEEMLAECIGSIYIDDASYPTSLSEEWSLEEVAGEILSQLNYGEYVDIGSTIYAIEDSLEEFLEGYNSGNDEDNLIDESGCAPLTPEEAARRLAKEIYN